MPPSNMGVRIAGAVAAGAGYRGRVEKPTTEGEATSLQEQSEERTKESADDQGNRGNRRRKHG